MFANTIMDKRAHISGSKSRSREKNLVSSEKKFKVQNMSTERSEELGQQYYQYSV
jgi:hypothetical protein